MLRLGDRRGGGTRGDGSMFMDSAACERVLLSQGVTGALCCYVKISCLGSACHHDKNPHKMATDILRGGVKTIRTDNLF